MIRQANSEFCSRAKHWIRQAIENVKQIQERHQLYLITAIILKI